MSSCICKPWRGYHCDACPCQVAYEEHKPPEPTDAQMSAARELVAAGFVQVSRKYRQVYQLPATGTALETLERLDPERAARIRADAAQKLESEARAVLWCYRQGETRELDPATFAAFQRVAKAVRA